MSEIHSASYKSYWITWFILLVATFGMILVSDSALPKTAFVALLLCAMLVKVALIFGIFMHLRFEKIGLVLMVVLGIIFAAVALFSGIAPDAIRSLHLR
jgi:cytochrome c oxidase subunit IV